MLRVFAQQIAPSLTRVLTHDAPRLAQPLSGRLSFTTEASTSQQSPPALVSELRTDVEFEAAMQESLETSGRVVLQFTAAWCGPCKMIGPVVEEYAHAFPDVKFYKVDIDKDAVSRSVSAAHVSAVPTFTFVKGGKVEAVLTGADRSQLKYNIEALRSS